MFIRNDDDFKIKVLCFTFSTQRALAYHDKLQKGNAHERCISVLILKAEVLIKIPVKSFRETKLIMASSRIYLSFLLLSKCFSFVLLDDAWYI
jgi:hypothetical protein